MNREGSETSEVRGLRGTMRWRDLNQPPGIGLNRGIRFHLLNTTRAMRCMGDIRCRRWNLNEGHLETALKP